MEEQDQALVRRFVDGDGRAFSIIIARYTEMVYSTCRRILQNDSEAADATQETFFHLLKSAARINGSLGSWLHQVATRRATDLIRQNTARRRRENAFAQEQAAEKCSSWTELEPLVDEAMGQLPEASRELLVLHFLERKAMTRIAATHGVSQPTISRRIAEGVELLREKLRAQGLTVGAVRLQSLLVNSSYCAPETLLRALAKMCLARAALGSSLSSSWVGIGAKVGISGAAAGLLLVTGWFFAGHPLRPRPVVTQPTVGQSVSPSAAQSGSVAVGSPSPVVSESAHAMGSKSRPAQSVSAVTFLARSIAANQKPAEPPASKSPAKPATEPKPEPAPVVAGPQAPVGLAPGQLPELPITEPSIYSPGTHARYGTFRTVPAGQDRAGMPTKPASVRAQAAPPATVSSNPGATTRLGSATYTPPPVYSARYRELSPVRRVDFPSKRNPAEKPMR